MAAHRPLLLLLAFVTALTQMGAMCSIPPLPKIDSPGASVNTLDFTLQITIPAGYTFDPVGDPPTGATVNLDPVDPGSFTGGPVVYTAPMGRGGALVEFGNDLLVKARRTSDNQIFTVGKVFDYVPPGRASAFEITNAGDLLTGPLAHNVVGDFMLRNTAARFVVQDAPQRDLYSTGQYGGNLIDAALVGVNDKEQFLEFSTMVNIETIANYTSVEVVNDGINGAAASVRACGPDDLLDFVNPSSQIIDALGSIPPTFPNDLNQPIEVCTIYSLEPFDSFVKVESEYQNSGATALPLIVGDWFSASGENDRFFHPTKGVGPETYNPTLGSFDFFGFDEGEGVDYQYTVELAAAPANGNGSYVTISGVTVVLHNVNAVLALLGLPPAFVVPAMAMGTPGTNSITRYFGVNDGAAHHGADLFAAVRGFNTATISGCVTANSVALPGAKVTAGTLSGMVIDQVLNHFVTDAAGCYSGTVRTNIAQTIGVAAAKKGHLYVGSAPATAVTNVPITVGGVHAVTPIDLPETGSLKVTVKDESNTLLPARVTVVGFDPSPPVEIDGTELPGFGVSTLGLFEDIDDGLPYGLVTFAYTGADGVAEFDLEPQGTDLSKGEYHVYVSRGTEYSLWRTPSPITITAGPTPTELSARIVRVLDTSGFISSDFHVHGIRSTDSRVSDLKRIEGFAGEGVDNPIMTDHHAHTDLDARIATEGLSTWITSTVGEEITTFDYGHFNGYPFLVDASVPSGGSTDWAQEAELGPGFDFPSEYDDTMNPGALNAIPSEIAALATDKLKNPNVVENVSTIQINHIGSHFGPLGIDTGVAFQDTLDDAGRLERRLPSTGDVANLFHHFPALELWNGSTPGAQSEFLDDRIGVWMNHLNAGMKTTFIADTDTHTFDNLRTAGARTWTAASAAKDTPATYDEVEMAASVDAGRAVGGQGIFVTTRLLPAVSGTVADLTFGGDTTMTDTNGDVDLEITIQAPLWAQYDTIEIYANAITVNSGGVQYGATPTVTINGPTINQVAVNGTLRQETVHTESFTGLIADTWFVVVVKGTPGTSEPMFPVYASGLSDSVNTTLANLIDNSQVGDGGTYALGATNALYFDAP